MSDTVLYADTREIQIHPHPSLFSPLGRAFCFCCRKSPDSLPLPTTMETFAETEAGKRRLSGQVEQQKPKKKRLLVLDEKRARGVSRKKLLKFALSGPPAARANAEECDRLTVCENKRTERVSGEGGEAALSGNGVACVVEGGNKSGQSKVKGSQETTTQERNGLLISNL